MLRRHKVQEDVSVKSDLQKPGRFAVSSFIPSDQLTAGSRQEDYIVGTRLD